MCMCICVCVTVQQSDLVVCILYIYDWICVCVYVCVCVSVQQSDLVICILYIHDWICVYVCVLVAQSCLTLCDPMDCSPPGYSVLGILQARILEWVAIPFSRGSSRLSDWTQASCIAGRFFTIWATREVHSISVTDHYSSSPGKDFT